MHATFEKTSVFAERRAIAGSSPVAAQRRPEAGHYVEKASTYLFHPSRAQ